MSKHKHAREIVDMGHERQALWSNGHGDPGRRLLEAYQLMTRWHLGYVNPNAIMPPMVEALDEIIQLRRRTGAVDAENRKLKDVISKLAQQGEAYRAEIKRLEKERNELKNNDFHTALADQRAKLEAEFAGACAVPSGIAHLIEGLDQGTQ